MQTLTAKSPNQTKSINRLSELLAQWQAWEQDKVRVVKTATGLKYWQIRLGNHFFDIGTFGSGGRYWNPLEIELVILDRSVKLAEDEQEWMSEIRSEYREGKKIHIARTHLNTHVVAYTEAEAEEPALARLAAYINALKGWWAS
jgi:hypothetical protein